jgi:CRP/FNR family transcriptional regulator
MIKVCGRRQLRILKTSVPYRRPVMRSLLHNITADLNAVLEKRGRKHSFNENEEIFAEGEEAGFLPIVLSGKVKMLHFLEGAKEVIIGIFSAGEMFAVPPVFDGKKYPSTAIAMERTELLMLDRKEFLALLGESNEFSFAVIGWMSEMLREKTATIQNLATASPEHRVGSVLLKLAESEPGTGPKKITLRRADIARIAGLTTETTIRVIRRLAEKRFINIEHGKVIIDEIEPLRKHVAG